jgi:hypothetical protein
MIHIKHQILRKLSKLLGLLVSTCAGLALLAFTWQVVALDLSAGTDDPEIQTIVAQATVPIYDPAGIEELERTIYFDNSNEGVLTTTLSISGTPTLTVTGMPAFGQPAFSQILTNSVDSVVITYPLSTIDESQLAITYTVVNTYEVAATALITYLRDITAPVSTLESLPPGGLVITTPDSSLVVTGTASDHESGIKAVWFDPGTSEFVSTELENTGDSVHQTTWTYIWSVPDVESGVYTLRYHAQDNIGHEETVHTYLVTVNNKPVAMDDAYNTPKNTPLVLDAPGILENDQDPRGKSLTAILETAPEAGTLALDPSGAFVYTPAAGYVGVVTFTYKAYNNAHYSDAATVTISILETDSFIYLPMVIKPAFALAGDLDFVKTDRFAGITTFKPQLQLDFRNMGFTYPPEEINIWTGNSEPADGWIPYVPTPLFDLTTPTIGGQEIHVKFRHKGETVARSAFFFYIPNGDFQDGQPGVEAHWSPKNNGLPWSVENNRLRLGSSAFGCTNMPFPASAIATIALDIPNTGYLLRVEAVVYTYDKLPDPGQDIYDAFEIHIGGQTRRYGYSGPELLNCNTQRIVPVDSTIPLTAGLHTLSLENHSRFDNYYNTYSDIIKVWVDR